MSLHARLVKAAIAQAEERFPSGYAGAAAIGTAEGEVLTSVFFDCPNECANLCHETGAILEAYRRRLHVTSSVCVSRLKPEEPFHILTPCGICQERLAYWGFDIEIVVPVTEDPTRWQVKTLREIQPYYWRAPFETQGESRPSKSLE